MKIYSSLRGGLALAGVRVASFSTLIALAGTVLLPSGASADMGWSPFPMPQVPQNQGRFVSTGRVRGFAPNRHGLRFSNYRYWEKSSLPEKLQLPHCTGMVLLVRQVFLHGSFGSGLGAFGKMNAEQAESRFRSIWNLDAGLLPGEAARMPLNGYPDLYELSNEPEMETAIKNVLGNAVEDAARSDWNWWVTDVYAWTRASRLRSDERARIDIDRGLPVIFYLLDGTNTAHAVLAYSYVETVGRTTYELYDSNHPGEVREAYIRKQDGKMVFEDQAKDPFILYPYNN